MSKLSLKSHVRSLALSFESIEATIWDLGTPVPLQNEAFRNLVSLPEDATPHLLELAQTTSPKIAAHLIAIIAQRGDDSVIEGIRAIMVSYERKKPKDEWHFAVIGQCRLAVKQLSGRANGEE